MNSVVLNTKDFENLIFSFDNLIKTELSNNNNVSDMTLKAKENLKSIQKTIRSVNLSSTLDALDFPIQTIIKEIVEIVADGKINIKDIGSFTSIINQLFKLRKLAPGIENEIKSLSKLEVQILASEIAGAVYDNINGAVKWEIY